MKDAQRITEAFTELAPRYEKVVDSELNRFWGWSYEEFVNELLESVQIPENDSRILDIATGTGVIPYRLGMKGLTPDRIYGLDITMAMLRRAHRRLSEFKNWEKLSLVCGSAMDMPYANSSFTNVICGLATHHMNVKKLLSEIYRVLREGSTLSIADAGGDLSWSFPGVKLLIRLAAFIYFSIIENNNRALAESGAVSNVHSKEDWEIMLMKCGFRNVTIRKLKSKYFWIPAPLIIQASKPNGGASWTNHSS